MAAEIVLLLLLLGHATGGDPEPPNRDQQGNDQVSNKNQQLVPAKHTPFQDQDTGAVFDLAPLAAISLTIPMKNPKGARLQLALGSPLHCKSIENLRHFCPNCAAQAVQQRTPCFVTRTLTYTRGSRNHGLST